METVLPAIVLSATDHGEADRLVTLLTAEGKVRAVLRGVKKPSAKLRAFAQPFAFGEFTLARGKGAYDVVTGASMTDSFFELSARPEKFFAGCFILETAERASEDTSAAKDVFLDVLRALDKLSYSQVPTPCVVIKYVLKLMSDLGYRQTVTKCAVCGELPTEFYYDVLNGGLQCGNCHTGRKLATAQASQLAEIACAPWDGLVGKEFPAADALMRFLVSELQTLTDKPFKTAQML